ncbi:anoctamin-10-like [Aplochiton taeniatus]
MTTLRDGLFLGGGSTWRKELINVNIGASSLPIRRLGEIAPLVLLEFHPEVEAYTVDWLLGKILAPESLGGADLLGRVIGRTRPGGVAVLVGATPERLILEADEDLLFRHKPRRAAAGHPPATVGDPGGAGSGAEEGLRGMLSSAECVTLVQRILGKLRVGEWEEVPGFPAAPGEAVLDSLHRAGVVTDSYPLHDAVLLRTLRGRLRAGWGSLMHFSPARHRHLLEEMRAYFGEKVALYFGFEGTVVNALLLKAVPSALLCLYPVHSSYGLVFFSVSGVVWSSLLLQAWREKSKDLRREWGTVVTHQPVYGQSLSSAPPSPTQRAGAPASASPLAPVAAPFPPQTQEASPHFGGLSLERVLCSVVYLISTLSLSSSVILAYLIMDKRLGDYLAREDCQMISDQCAYLYLPEVSLTLVMAAVDRLAFLLYQSLSSKPSHRGLQPSFHRFPSLLPEFVFSCLFNHFGIHFYRVLVQGGPALLPHHLSVQLATQLGLKLASSALLTITTSCGRAAARRQIAEQGTRPPGDLQTWSYLELLVSYCHVMLFSGVHPQVVFWVLLSAVIRSELGLRRLCCSVRRPFPQAVPQRGICVWERAFRVAEGAAVVFNSALLWCSPELRHLVFGSSHWQLLRGFLLLPMLLLALKEGTSFGMFRLAQAAGCQGDRGGLRHPRLHRLHRHQSQHQHHSQSIQGM